MDFVLSIALIRIYIFLFNFFLSFLIFELSDEKNMQKALADSHAIGVNSFHCNIHFQPKT